MKFHQAVWLMCLGFLALSELVIANTCTTTSRSRGAYRKVRRRRQRVGRRSDIDPNIAHIIKIEKRLDPNGFDGKAPINAGQDQIYAGEGQFKTDNFAQERSGYGTTERPNTLRDLGLAEGFYQRIFRTWSLHFNGDLWGKNFGEILPEDVEEFEDVGEFGNTGLNLRNPIVNEAYGLLPRNTRIVQVLDDNLIFDDGRFDNNTMRDTGVVFQERPICLNAYQLKMVTAQSYGKFDEDQFFEQFNEAIDRNEFKRLPFDKKLMYETAKKYKCKRIVPVYGNKIRTYVIDDIPCDYSNPCDEDGYPIVQGTYGNSHTHNYYFASRSDPDRQSGGAMRCRG